MVLIKTVNNRKQKRSSATAGMADCGTAKAETGFPLFWKKKIPGVFQSNFRIFQLLSVIVRNRISNTFGPQ